MVAWSPNGYYLATVGIDKQILIWDLSPKSNRENIQGQKLDSIICGISWHPKSNALAVIDKMGNYAIWDSPVPAKGFPSPFALTEELKRSSEAQQALADMFKDDEPAKPSEKPTKEGKNKIKKQVVDDRDPLDIIDGMDADPIDYSDVNEEEDEVEEFDEEEESVPKTSKESYLTTVGQIAKREKKAALATSASTRTVRVPFTADIVKPFQPCASETDKKRKFLAFNRVGTILSRDEHDKNSIEIEFHDITAHRPMKISDHNGISIATMSMYYD
jgi:chromosome transmission fidelity protein 4